MPQCDIPLGLIRFTYALGHLAKSIGNSEAIKVVAIGSSSTKGEGASTAANSYPAKLEEQLALLIGAGSVTVRNKGVGGRSR